MRRGSATLAALLPLVMVSSALAQEVDAGPGARGQVFDSAASATETYEIDTGHSYIGFAVRHMGVARVRGFFTEFSGMIRYYAEDITGSSVRFGIATASVDTNNERRDRDIKGERLLDVANYPEITFESRRIEATEEGFEATGDLTLHGVTREVVIPFEFAPPVDTGRTVRLGVEARLEINRKDYGIQFSRTVDNGALIVGNKVVIELDVAAVRVSD